MKANPIHNNIQIPAFQMNKLNYLNNAANLLLPNRCKILQSKAMVLDPINKLLNPGTSLNPYSLLLLIHLKYLIHKRKIDHPSPRQAYPVWRKTRPNRANLLTLLMGILDKFLEIRNRLGLEEIPGMHLVGPTPIGDSVKIFRKRGVLKELGFLVLGIFREGEGVVGGRTATQKEEKVPDVFPGFRGGGGRGGGGERAQVARGDDGGV